METALTHPATAREFPSEAAGESDQLGASVLRSLTRSLHGQFSLSPLQATGLGLLTFGVLPLLRLHRDLRNYATLEGQQMWHVAEWVRVRVGGQEASELADHAARMRSGSEGGFFFAAALLAIAAAGFTLMLTMGDEPSWRALMDRTYRVRSAASVASPVAMGFIAWNVGLSVAYVLHWLRVRAQVNRLIRFAARFDAFALREGVDPLTPPRQRIGLTISWIIGAAVSCGFGAFWGVPLALAGASQRVYINDTAGRLRIELLERLRSTLAQQRPAVAVPSYVIPDRRCPNALCRAVSRAGSRFCPRCGTAPDGGTLRAIGSV